MRQVDVLIVGGGPAGASCARALRQGGADCLIIDQHSFPRAKPCAGWITPAVIRAAGLLPASYPGSITTFTAFDIAIRALRFRLPTRQFAIRRWEFDAWLLEQCGAPVEQHTVRNITRVDGLYQVDDVARARYLIGAGGTHCPVRRALFDPQPERQPQKLIVALEEEFQYTAPDARCRLWFFQNGLPGYAWYVPKAGGWLNVGIGATAAELKAGGESLKSHWARLVDQLNKMGLVSGHEFKPQGHSYLLRGRNPALSRDNAFLVGDAAGLATLDMGEGIGPALLSGQRAASAILDRSDYHLVGIPRYSFPSILISGVARPPG